MAKTGLNYRQKLSFTLIEVLFVITIMAIIAAAVIPRVGRGGLYDKFLVYTSAHQIAADLRLARRLTVTNRNPYRVKFIINGSSSDYNQYVLQAAPSWANVSVVKTIDDSIVISGSDNITFTTTGAANADHSYNLSLNAHSYTIDVKAATGRVKLE